MAQSSSAPYAAQDVSEVTRLICDLEDHSEKEGKGKQHFTCRKATFVVPGPGNVNVESWRFQDSDYKKKALPTNARGLFTRRLTDGTPEIVVRGYDKFFNVDEVSTTQWDHIKHHTRPPYELSLKENGCIIFISSLSDDTLLVCSKHSTGPRHDIAVNHAMVGEKWVDRQLAACGKTRADLARELRRRNATAVAELCDDSFEEHILAYNKDRAGLYLHGINLNLPEFATYPGPLLHAFADEWGFRKTEFLAKDNLQGVRSFLEDVGETGAWNGRDVEGFVIRCQARASPSDSWSDWFFKYKYEEPYLLYRQWREVTKAIIAGRQPRYKKHKELTEEYLLYARRRLAHDPSLATQFNLNHGIIAMRNGFLKEKGLNGADVIRQATQDAGDTGLGVFKDVVLLPVATIGCGKTTVALALCKLFDWGHVQNDNIQGKGDRPKRFVTEVCHNMAANPVVIADRNNHQRRERKQLIEDVRRIVPSATFVALHYVHEREALSSPDYRNQIRTLTRDRVLSRGDNHQTIRAGSKSRAEITSIMDGFLKRFEPLNPHTHPDDDFDTIIDLDVLADSRANLETVVSKLHERYPQLFKEIPTSDELDEAIESAMRDYHPDVKHDLSSSRDKRLDRPQHSRNNGSKEPRIEYFCIAVPTQPILDSLTTTFKPQAVAVSLFFRQLQHSRRLQPSFHVTLIHRANSESSAEVWQRYNTLLQNARSALPTGQNAPPPLDMNDRPLGSCRVQLERIVWNHRVMCIVVRLLDAQEQGFHCSNQVSHITVGTASPQIKPKESNDLLAAWLSNGSGQASGIDELRFDPRVVLLGTVKAVSSR